jgi:hypothetical protein
MSPAFINACHRSSNEQLKAPDLQQRQTNAAAEKRRSWKSFAPLPKKPVVADRRATRVALNEARAARKAAKKERRRGY